ncbi:MAG: hypothetical protein OXC31_26300 [Spirochaetaceae bacterium]|nr:hypothetical protein [Spirochaetaceae bacterium]
MDDFFRKPILNSPYEYPGRHWELDENRQPTNLIIDQRRSVSLITPIPAARKRVGSRTQVQLTEMIDAVRPATREGAAT